MIRSLLLTSGGLGHLRPAPGTWGSIPPAALAWLMLVLGAPAWTLNAALAVVLVLACAICIALGAWGEQRFGRKDASPIVIDETAGQCIPLMFWPAGVIPPTIGEGERLLHASLAVAGAFVLFRIFDIIKPPPAHRLQRLPGGWGVLIDDLFAGLYAAIVVQVALRLIA